MADKKVLKVRPDIQFGMEVGANCPEKKELKKVCIQVRYPRYKG